LGYYTYMNNTNTNAAQTTIEFNYDSNEHGNVHVFATFLLGQFVQFNAVNRNSDWKDVEFNKSEYRDARQMARWYFEDENA
jgi:hypothetical protein